MEFVKEFATFLHQNGIIKFGDFTLASGKKSPYYIDLRAVPSYPHQFRRMIKHLQNAISEKTGLDSFDAIASVPTGGLVIASALALETVKPLIYIRSEAKQYGTGKLVEGVIRNGMRVLFVDDVATTGGSVIKGIRALSEAGVKTSDCYVIANRMEGASEALRNEGVTLHHLFSIPEIAEILYRSKLIDDATLKRVQVKS
ncbi:MAG: orotate phosphoribosyltransferase [Candidatus Nitrosotenuis sp.]